MNKGDFVKVVDVRRLSKRGKVVIAQHDGVGVIEHVCLNRNPPEVCVGFGEYGFDRLWLSPKRLVVEAQA